MVEKVADNTYKINNIGQLKLALNDIESIYNNQSMLVAHDKYHAVLEAVLQKIASMSCTHPPTWCKALIETGKKIDFISEDENE